MAWEVERIQTSDEKEIPYGTKVQLSQASFPGHVHVRLQFPGQIGFSDLGDLPIINRIVELPMKLGFLCHAHEDKKVVESISKRLRRDGFLTWLDKRELLPGDDWKTVIGSAIERADFVLVFLSKTSVSKIGYVQREIKYAFEQREMRPYGYRYIIPVLIEPCEPPRPFHDIQWLELWQEGAYEKLKQAVKGSIKAHQSVETERSTERGEEEGVNVEEIPLEVERLVSIEKDKEAVSKEGETEKQFSTWVKKENDNAINEMTSAGFTEGFFKFVIQVPYGVDPIDSATLLEIARKSECHKTGWPIGVVMMKPEYKPAPLADGIRAIMNTGDGFDYWALNNRGHFFFIRSHQEDASHVQKLAEESKFLWFDTTTWRISEIFCYVSNMCTELNLKQSDKIKLTISYEGIKDRVLSISNRRGAPFSRVRRCSVDKYEKDLELQVVDIMPKLKDHVYEVVKGLFGFFDFYKSDRALVDSIIDEFLNSRL